MELTKYIACICEGGAECAIMDMLLDADCLIFQREDLIDGELIRHRSAGIFEQKYLRKSFPETISIIRILDSRSEKFSIKPAYQHKVSSVINVRTTPEIEMLHILHENRYNDYLKSKKKPSDFCVQNMGLTYIKQPETVKSFYKDISDLLYAIKLYREKCYKSGEYCLYDLLEPTKIKKYITW